MAYPLMPAPPRQHLTVQGNMSAHGLIQPVSYQTHQDAAAPQMINFPNLVPTQLLGQAFHTPSREDERLGNQASYLVYPRGGGF